MKKILSIMFLAVISVSVVFAIDMSAGGGLRYAMTSQTMKVENESLESASTDIVLNGFFDATYVLGELGFAKSLTKTYEGDDTDVGTTALNIGVFGKYPITVGSAVVFPLAGFEYVSNLGVTYDGEDVKSDMSSDEKSEYNQLWFKFGAGADFAVTPKIYIRPMATLGYKFYSEDEQDLIDLADDLNVDFSIITMKFDLGVAVGFKL